MHLTLLATVVAMASLAPVGSVPPSSDLVASVHSYEAAANRHDWAAVRPLLADNAVIELGGDLAIVGSDNARALHDWERAMGTQIHYSDCRAEGQTVTCRASEQNDFLRLSGLGPIEYEASRITFEGGRVVRMSATLSAESGNQVAGYMQGFLEWANKVSPDGVATFLNADGSFAFGFESAQTFKRLVRVYALTRRGSPRAL